VVLPGAGHVPTVTRPQEVVAAIDRWAGKHQLLA
jgi:pimeloyl-ACP methyl ester carboxylesterase